MSDLIPLYVSSLDSWAQYRDTFRRAKQLDPRLARFQLQPTDAHPGCQRLVAFSDHPEFCAEYALIRRSPAEFTEKLALDILLWYCQIKDDPRIFGYEQWLGRVLGQAKEVVE